MGVTSTCTLGNRKLGTPTKLHDSLRLLLKCCWDRVGLDWRMNVLHQLTEAHVAKCSVCDCATVRVCVLQFSRP